MNLSRHIVLWLGVVLLLTLVFGRSYESYADSFYFVCMLLPVIAATTYAFNYYLVPNYLLKEKYFKFSLYFFYVLVISLNLEMLVITGAFIILAEYNYANLNPVTADVFVLTTTMYAIVLAVAFIRMAKFFLIERSEKENLEHRIDRNTTKRITVIENRKKRILELGQILFVESLDKFVKIELKDGSVIETKEKISELERRLPDDFIRVHRSIIVNTINITSYSKEAVIVGGSELPISRTYKTSALAALANSE